MIGLPELIAILVVGAIVLFGGKKIVDLGRSMGRFAGEFKKGKVEVEKELKEVSEKEGKKTAKKK